MTANTEIKLRPLAAGDLAAVTRLDATNGGESRAGFFERRLQAEQQSPAGFFSCVAERGGEVAGFLLGHLLDGEFGGLERVAVLDAVAIDPAAQRQGLARKLVGEFDRNARERGASEMRTQAQWDRPGLVEFFSAAGFRLSPRLVLERPTEYVKLLSSRPETTTWRSAMTTRPHPTTKQLLDQFNNEPDYSDVSQDDAEALSRDRIPVRSLTAADFDAVVRIDRRSTGHDRSAYYRRKFDEALGESGVRVSVVAEQDGMVAGFLMARVDFGEFGRGGHRCGDRHHRRRCGGQRQARRPCARVATARQPDLAARRVGAHRGRVEPLRPAALPRPLRLPSRPAALAVAPARLSVRGEPARGPRHAGLGRTHFPRGNRLHGFYWRTGRTGRDRHRRCARDRAHDHRCAGRARRAGACLRHDRQQ